jgi:hypothetical protein
VLLLFYHYYLEVRYSNYRGNNTGFYARVYRREVGEASHE